MVAGFWYLSIGVCMIRTPFSWMLNIWGGNRASPSHSLSTCPNTANGNTDGEYPSPHLRFFLLTPVPSTGWYFYFWRPKKRNLSVDVGEGKLLWQILYIGWFYYVCEWQFILFSHFWFSFFSLSISCHPILPCGCQLICVFKPKGYNNY